jgi:hypothetical protein
MTMENAVVQKIAAKKYLLTQETYIFKFNWELSKMTKENTLVKTHSRL